MPELLLLLQLSTCLAMTGLIWYVQVVSYPLFHKVGAAAFPAITSA
ncbi:MAG: hypothetical protein HC904_01125 [Blastochloris sp.]|nr:hypothetical protein [Blastochloris sp.]